VQSGGAAPAARAPTRLTKRVRKLYEESAVPVREIAAAAGVTERTVYKYAAKHDWRPRYRWRADGARPAGRRAASGFAPVKGAGGRFIARADRDKPVAAGLKATDPRAASRALAACAQAEALAREAQAEAAWLRWSEVILDWLKTARILRDALAAHQARRGRAAANGVTGATDAYAQWLTRAGHVAVDCLQFCHAQRARCGFIESLERAAALRAKPSTVITGPPRSAMSR